MSSTALAQASKEYANIGAYRSDHASRPGSQVSKGVYGYVTPSNLYKKQVVNFGSPSGVREGGGWVREGGGWVRGGRGW